MKPARPATLHLVDSAPKVQHRGRDATRAEEMLLAIVPELSAAEAAVRRLHQHMIAETRLVARERGVSFIREEHIRGEFGNG